MTGLIYATTSQGVYGLDAAGERTPAKVLAVRQSALWRRTEKLGFFGIAIDQEGSLFFAERVRRSWITKKQATRIHISRSEYGSSFSTIKASNCADVHQIAIENNHLFLTDTARNRIVIFDVRSQKVKKEVNIGGNRKDVNHVNAVIISDSGLLVGLNNRGVKDSCILHIPRRYLYSEGLCFDALSVSRRTNLESITDTHDLELIDGRFICCASKDGRVIDANTKETIYQDDGWVRGITFDEDYIYVGVSQIAARAERHKHVMSPKVVWLSRSDYSYEGEQIISQGGQVNDLLHIADPKIR